MWQIKFENSFSTKTQFIDLGLRILKEIQSQSSSSSSIISISSSSSKNDEIKREEDDKSESDDGRSFQTSKAGFFYTP